MISLFGKPGQSIELLASKLIGAEGELLVCWGAAGVPGALNSKPCLSAVEQLRVFREAGLLIPDYTKVLAEARQWIGEGELVFGRTLYHTRGRDIVGPRSWRWPYREYWVKVVREPLEEWRVHVFGGRSIARGVKVLTGTPWRKMPVRNRGNGWTMRHDIEPLEGLRSAAKGAVEACGYDFGAVDLLVKQVGCICGTSQYPVGSLNERSSHGDGCAPEYRYYVLEVNKRPGLDDYTAGKYAEAIRRRALGGRGF